MTWRNTAWPGVLILVGVGGWLLFGQGRTWGIDHGLPGMLLLVAAGWAALWVGASRQQRASGEWTAWVGLCLTLFGLAYFARRWWGVITTGSDADAHWLLVNLMLLLLGWTVLLQLWAGHWRGRVQTDPAIRPWLGHEPPYAAQIERQAAESGRMALTFGLICLALLLGFLPETRLGWMHPLLLANLLLFVLMWGWLVEYVATVWLYWHDRRARRLQVQADAMIPPA